MKDSPNRAFSPSEQAEHCPMYIARCVKCGWPFSTPHMTEVLCKRCRETASGGVDDGCLRKMPALRWSDVSRDPMR